MENNETIILDLIVNNIITEIGDSNPDERQLYFLVEKILLKCGFPEENVDDIIVRLNETMVELNQPPVWKSNLSSSIVKDEITMIVNQLFETSRKKMDKVAVRNKQSGAIQLVSKKTYQSNSQIYTPLSAGWAKANVVMIRNKTSGEEYPILLKNFDSNKHEKITTAVPPVDQEKGPDMGPPKLEQPPKKKDRKPKDEPAPESGKDTVRPMMVAPSLRSKTMTAFITPKSSQSLSLRSPEFPNNYSDVIGSVTATKKDTKLSPNNPINSKSFKSFSSDDPREKYEYLGSIGLLPSDFDFNKKFTIPNGITSKLKIPREYISAIEYLSNSIKGDSIPISAFNLPLPLTTNPNAYLSLFELLLLYSVTLNDEEFARFTITIEMFINKHDNVNLTHELWETVKSERKLIMSHIIKKHGNAFDIVAGAWKVEEHQLELGVDDSNLDFEKISDIFLRISTHKDNLDVLEEFLVTPNKQILSILDKDYFKEFLSTDKEHRKERILFFLLKMFPLHSILNNQLSVVFPNVIYDYYTLIEIFKTSSIASLDLKLQVINNKIVLSYENEGNVNNILFVKIKDPVEIIMDPNLENDVIRLNKINFKKTIN